MSKIGAIEGEKRLRARGGRDGLREAIASARMEKAEQEREGLRKADSEKEQAKKRRKLEGGGAEASRAACWRRSRTRARKDKQAGRALAKGAGRSSRALVAENKKARTSSRCAWMDKARKEADGSCSRSTLNKRERRTKAKTDELRQILDRHVIGEREDGDRSCA